MQDSFYDVAQVCLNGHLITQYSKTSPQHMEEFCAKCGQRTITTCPACNEPIRGFYHVEGVISFGSDYSLPSYCYKCGKAYPWTSSRLEAAAELVREAELLDQDEQTQLIESLDDIVADSPRTQLAATRAKRLLSKAGLTVANVFRDMIVDIASEAAKKILFP